MLSTVTNAITRFLRGRPSGSGPAHQPRVCLHVETMELRLVPSTSPVALAAHPSDVANHAGTPALAAPANEGGVSTPVSPERNVHGYKWRNPIYFPHIDAPAQPAPTLEMAHVPSSLWTVPLS